MARTWLRLFAGATLTLSLAGHALADEGKITVFAAASLTNAMQDIAAAYKKEKNVEVVSSFASSSTLARQIEAGAPADLFISADQKWMDYAVEKKRLIRQPAKRCWVIAWLSWRQKPARRRISPSTKRPTGPAC
jgi:molybdate transport system substrate-binding protein